MGTVTMPGMAGHNMPGHNMSRADMPAMPGMLTDAKMKA